MLYPCYTFREAWKKSSAEDYFQRVSHARNAFQKKAARAQNRLIQKTVASGLAEGVTSMPLGMLGKIFVQIFDG